MGPDVGVLRDGRGTGAQPDRGPARRAGLSRQELADVLGIHYRTVTYLERGDYSPDLALALRISAFFELPVEAVFALTPFPPLSAHLRRTGTEGP